MILSDKDIITALNTGDLTISPFDQFLVRPASICLRLGQEFLLIEASDIIDVKEGKTLPSSKKVTCSIEEGILLPAKTLVLGRTLEKIAISRRMAGWLSTTSSLARLGLQVATSHYVSPGFGEAGLASLTLELYNTLDVAIRVYPQMCVCHLIVSLLANSSEQGYDQSVAVYSHQDEPKGSQISQELS